MMGPVAGAALLSLLDLQLRNILGIPYIGDWLKALSQSFFTLTGVSNIQLIIFGLILVLDHGVRAPGDIRDLDPRQEILEDPGRSEEGRRPAEAEESACLNSSRWSSAESRWEAPTP